MTWSRQKHDIVTWSKQKPDSVTWSKQKFDRVTKFNRNITVRLTGSKQTPPDSVTNWRQKSFDSVTWSKQKSDSVISSKHKSARTRIIVMFKKTSFKFVEKYAFYKSPVHSSKTRRFL